MIVVGKCFGCWGDIDHFEGGDGFFVFRRKIDIFLEILNFRGILQFSWKFSIFVEFCQFWRKCIFPSAIKINIQSCFQWIARFPVVLTFSAILRNILGNSRIFQKLTNIIEFWITLFICLVLPEEGPKISGGRSRYQIGDAVNVNCTSGRSKPATHLTWFINGEPANASYLRHYSTFITGREGLETTTLGLQFRVKANSFRHGDMKLKVRRFLSILWAIAIIIKSKPSAFL